MWGSDPFHISIRMMSNTEFMGLEVSLEKVLLTQHSKQKNYSALRFLLQSKRAVEELAVGNDNSVKCIL